MMRLPMPAYWSEDAEVSPPLILAAADLPAASYAREKP